MKQFFCLLSFVLSMVYAQEAVTIRLAAASQLESLQEAAERYMAANPHKVGAKSYTVTVEIQEPDESGNKLKDAFTVLLDARSPEFDIFQAEISWLGDMSSYFANLYPYPGFAEAARQQFPAALEAATNLEGNLIAFPYSLDVGLLYYRSDLLERYGFSKPGANWPELVMMAEQIQIGERAAGIADFWGFVWQGSFNEDLSSNVLEWLAANRAGHILSQEQAITVNNPKALEVLELASSWLGSISPAETLSLDAQASAKLFEQGKAAFMRNWYSAKPGSIRGGFFKLAALPAAETGGVLGGQYLGLSKGSEHPQVAADVLLFFSSLAEQKQRAINHDLAPSLPSLYRDTDVLLANPSLVYLEPALAQATVRPTMLTLSPYLHTSRLFAKAVHNVLMGEVEAATALTWLELDLQDLTGFPTGAP